MRSHPQRSRSGPAARPRVAALLAGLALVLGCHLDDLLRAPSASDGEEPPSGNQTAVALAFTVQPATTRTERAIAPPVEVTAVDAAGGTVTTFTGDIRVELAGDPEDARLSGNTSRRAVAGRAVFDNLAVNETGSGYRLTATADGLSSATSAPFDVTRRQPSVLMPVSGNNQTDTVAATLQPYVVRVTDDAGNPVGGVEIRWVADGGAVTPAVSFSDPAGQASTVQTLGTLPGAYGAAASTPELPERTVIFTSTARAGTATALVFTQQPTNTERRRRITPAVQVTARDQFGNTTTGYRTTVTMAIAPGTGSPGATLEGDRTRNPDNGVATFDDLKIEDVGFGYRLLATSGTLSALSDPFNILLLAADTGREALWTLALEPRR